MARDPNLERLIATLSAPPAEQKPKGVGIADYAKELAAGATQAAGYGIRGIGEAINAPARQGTQSARSLLLDASPLIHAGDAIAAKGDALQSTISDAAKARIAGSTPSGELLHPSSWSLGTDPSVSGYALQAANVLGQVAPVAATGGITKGRVLPTAGVAAALGGGAAGAQEQQRIEQMTPEQLAAVPAYQKLIAAGLDPATAQRALAERTGSRAALTTMPVSALSAFTEGLPMAGFGQKALSKVVGTSKAARMGTGAVLDSLAEGGQEALEQVAQTYGANSATGEQRSLGEDTFQNAVLGGIGAAPLGALGGLHDVEAGATPAPSAADRLASAPAETAATEPAVAPQPVAQAPAFRPTQNPVTGAVQVAPGVEVHEADGALSKALVEGARQGALDRPAVTTLEDGSSVDTATGELLAPASTEAQGTAAPTEQAPASTASVPFMITAAQRRDLTARGYDRKSIAKMTPAQAQEILAQPDLTATPAPDDTELNAILAGYRDQAGGIDAARLTRIAQHFGVSEDEAKRILAQKVQEKAASAPDESQLDAIVAGYYDAYGVLDSAVTGRIAARFGVPREAVSAAKKRVTQAKAAAAAPNPTQESTHAQEAPQGAAEVGAHPAEAAAQPGDGEGQGGPVADAGRDSGDAAGADGEAGQRNEPAGAAAPHAGDEQRGGPRAEHPAEGLSHGDQGGQGAATGARAVEQGTGSSAARSDHGTDAAAAGGETEFVRPGVPAQDRTAQEVATAQPAAASAATATDGTVDHAAAPDGEQAGPDGATGGAGTAPEAAHGGAAGPGSRAETGAAQAPVAEPKWFGSQAKADGYLKRKKLTDTHEVVNTGKRFEVRPKADVSPVAAGAQVRVAEGLGSDVDGQTGHVVKVRGDTAVVEVNGEKYDMPVAELSAAPTERSARPMPDRADPLFERKNVLRQLQNGLDGTHGPDGRVWTPEARAKVERNIADLQAEIAASEGKAKAAPAAPAAATDKSENERIRESAVYAAHLPGSQAKGVHAAEIAVAKTDDGQFHYAVSHSTGVQGSGHSFKSYRGYHSPGYATAEEARAGALDAIEERLPKRATGGTVEAGRIKKIREWIEAERAKLSPPPKGGKQESPTAPTTKGEQATERLHKLKKNLQKARREGKDTKAIEAQIHRTRSQVFDETPADAKPDTADFTRNEAPAGATFLYDNDKGERVYLDDNGRFVLEDGARVYQKREMRPTRAENGGIRYEHAAMPEARYEQSTVVPAPIPPSRSYEDTLAELKKARPGDSRPLNGKVYHAVPGGHWSDGTLTVTAEAMAQALTTKRHPMDVNAIEGEFAVVDKKGGNPVEAAMQARGMTKNGPLRWVTAGGKHAGQDWRELVMDSDTSFTIYSGERPTAKASSLDEALALLDAPAPLTQFEDAGHQGRAPMALVSQVQMATGWQASTMSASDGVARFRNDGVLGSWTFNYRGRKPGDVSRQHYISVDVQRDGSAKVARWDDSRGSKPERETLSASGITAGPEWAAQTTAFLDSLNPKKEAAPAAAAEPKAKPSPSKNTIFTDDAAEKARALLRKKLGQLSSGVDPEILQAGLTLAGYHIEKGARTFTAYARAMLSDMGELVRPFLKSWYMGVKYDPRASAFEGMSTAAEVEAADVSSFAIDEAKEVGNEPASTDGANAPALAEVPAGENPAAESDRHVGSGDAGRGEGGVGRNRGADAAGVSAARSGGSGAAEARPTQTRARRGHAAAAAPRVGDAGEGVPERAARVTPPAPVIPAQDFQITDAVELGKGGEARKFADNLAAIRVLKTLEADNRRATADEQATLARYVGWGGLANAFAGPDGTFKPDWEAKGKELADLLTPKELAAARRSTRNAHYTSATVVKGLWSALERLGFAGGTVLEPSVGTGNFLGLQPAQLRGKARFVGIELDSLTARIAGALYPNETILASGFQKVPLADNSIDVMIGNPPFGQESLNFQFKPELNSYSIHNQFALASMDAVKPGGLMGMVVSRYLMDAKDASARRKLAEQAELVGAIRLPDTAFKENARTEVVTDLLLFRKRTVEEQAAWELDRVKDREAKRPPVDPEWVDTTDVADPLGGEKITVNRHFAANPHMILGTLERSGKMAHGNDVTVRGSGDLAAALDKAIAQLPKDVMRSSPDAVAASLARYKGMTDALKLALTGAEAGAIRFTADGKLEQVIERETPEGGHELTVRTLSPESPWSPNLYQDADGHWFRLVEQLDAKGAKVKQVVDGKVTRLNAYTREVFKTDAEVPKSLTLGKAAFTRLHALAKLRDLLKDQLTLEAENAPASQLEANRDKLRGAYEAFQKAYGYINEPSNAKLVSEMPDGALVLALEHGYRAKTSDTAASAKPAPILSERVVVPYAPPEQAASPADALAITRAETGHVDLARVAALLGTDEDGAIAALVQHTDRPLVFHDPETGRWESRDDYLTGPVRRKLAAARAAGLAENVAALEAVQPEPWGAENVSVSLGASWVPSKVYAGFAEHLTGGKAHVFYSSLTNTFQVSIQGGRTRGTDWSTDDVAADDLLSDLLNSRSTVIRRRTTDGKSYIDEEATTLAQLKRKAIASEFADWVFADAGRRNELVELFNDKFNTRVARQYDGSHLALPGKVPDAVIRMRRHQKNAIWRGISERFMLVDHVVGAGKTFTAIARAMERRRMGLARKPMIAVPNHLVDQWAADVYRLYPGAKVLAAGTKDFEKVRRRRLFAKIATGDWDVVIVPHSSFGFIGIAPETEERYLTAEIERAAEAMKEAEEAAAEEGFSGFGKPIGVKEAERVKEKLEARLSKLKSSTQDKLLTFEQMGVDDLTVDEAHEFKNLFYTSRLTGVRGMGNKQGSRKALDLYNKVRVLRESPTGAVTFMTGTPISNSAVEMFTMMRYLAADELSELGLENFDAWRAQYVEADPAFEPTETGSLAEVTRLGRSWSNMRALMELYSSFTDSVSSDDIERWYAEDNNGARFPVPKVAGGGRQSVVVPPTPAQATILDQVVAGFRGLKNIRDPKERNKERLRLMDRARKVALDARAAGGHTVDNEAGGKLQVIADEVTQLYHQHTADKGTQLVFLDRSVPKAKGDEAIIKAYDDLKARQNRALAEGDDEAFMALAEQLEKFDSNEIEELRAAQRGGWNAYQQLKDNLIERGIPANEIRFVQEANNDAQKKALFDAVNAGEVRVLIGSTPRMGAGTNVQERLVGLHHADVTWKPSDIEQREGRIIRQGNQLLAKHGEGFEVAIKAYATERTIDAKMWDLNSQKLKTINAIRKYDGQFTMDFEDEDAVGMAEMAALASGDPLLMERVKLGSEIDKLELVERAQRRKRFGLESRLHDAQQTLEKGPAQLARLEGIASLLERQAGEVRAEAAARAVTIEGESFQHLPDAMRALNAAIDAQKAGDKKAKFAVEVAGKRYTAVNAAEDALEAALGDVQPFAAVIDGTAVTRRTDAARLIGAAITGTTGEVDGLKLGTLFGLPLVADLSHDEWGYSVALSLVDADGNTLLSLESKRQKERAFGTQQLRSLVGDLAYYVDENGARGKAHALTRRMREAEAAIPEVEAQLAKPAEGLDELPAKRARLAEVVRELAAKEGVNAKQAEANTAFSKADGQPTGGMDADVLRRAIAQQTGAWTAAPSVEVVASAEALPAAIRARPDFDAGVEAVHAGGKVYLIADRLPNLARARAVLAHEVIGHTGMRAILGKEGFRQVQAQLVVLRDAGKLPELFAELARRYGAMDDATLTHEALAVMAEKGMRNTLMGRVLAALRTFLRQLGFTVAFSEGDLRQLVTEAGRYIEQGGRAEAESAAPAVAYSQQTITSTPAFRRWFGDSKVVDAEGRPLVVYHGSRDGQRAVFDTGNRAGYKGRPSAGAYFTAQKDQAEAYGSSMHPVYLNIQNPFVIRSEPGAYKAAPTMLTAEKIAEYEARGYDGIVYHWNDAQFGNMPFNEVVAFHPEQIKSATGNRGTFDPTDPNINYSRRDPADPLRPRDPQNVVFGSSPYFANNASGESSASLEAIHRIADEKAAGQLRMRIERDGSVTPLFGVDAVDTFARDGQLIVQRHVGADEWTVLSADASLGKDVIAGKLNAARMRLNAEADALAGDVDEWSPDDLPAVAWSKRDPNVVLDDLEKASRFKVTDVVQSLRDKREDWRPGWLGLLTLRQLAEVAGKYLPRIGTYADTVQAMQTRRNALQEEAATLADRWWQWQRKHREESTVLTGVMHDATLAGVDPAEDFVPGTVTLAGGEVVPMLAGPVRKAIRALNAKAEGAPSVIASILRADAERLRETLKLEAARREAYPDLQKRFAALPAEAQALYREVRDAYKGRADAMQEALIKRIGGLELPEGERKALADRVRAHFESARVQAPYFPLARFGDYWVSAEKDGVREFRMMENRAQQRRVQATYAKAGWSTKAGAKIDMARAIDGASASFMAQVTQTLADNGVDKDVADEVYQLYLRTLPDLSVRKQFIHRKGVEGYDADALRAFAAHMNHGAYQLARLEHTHKMEKLLGQMRQDVRQLANDGTVEAIKAARAMAEVDKRHAWVMNPKDAAWVQRVSAANFAYYLGATPAAALVNLTQGAVTTFPALAARHGWIKAMGALVKGMRQSIRTNGKLEKVLSGDELRAHEALTAMGAIDKTRAHDLAGMGEGSLLAYNPAWRRTMGVVSGLFHKAEVFNREAAGLAAYRLARANGESHEAAVKYAADTIFETHFDYSNANRARFMQSNSAKVLFAFKQYSQHMSYFLWRNFYQAIRGASKQEKAEARRKLVGACGMTAIFAGALGLPMMSLMFGVANLMHAAFGDDDEPWDAETEFRNFLVEMLGPTFGQIAATGPMNAATGLDFASRTKLSDLWFRSPDMELEGRAQYDYWLEQVAGPVGGMFANAFRAQQLASDGELWRATETLLPKAVRDSLKAVRYATEGANTLRGDPLVADLSPYQELMQAAGFSPAKVAEQYERNNALKAYEQHILQRRRSLMDGYAMAVRMRDQDMMDTFTSKIEAFNSSNPEIGITAGQIRRSLQARERYSAQAVDGIVLNKHLAAKLQARVLGGED